MFGMRIIEDRSLTNTVEDWSDVRSPSRAARRRRQGHKQRIRYVQVPKPDVYVMGNAMVAHPDTMSKIVRKIRSEFKERIDDQLYGGLFG